MAKTLMKSLKTELTGDLPAIAALLQSKGRNKDTILAHITPKEAALLKKRGGSGSTNPDTGLLEFDDSFDAPDTGFSAEFAPVGSTVSQAPDMTAVSFGGAPGLPQGGPISDALPAQQYTPQATPDLQLQPPVSAPLIAPAFGQGSAMPGYSTGYPEITQPPTRFAETQPDFGTAPQATPVAGAAPQPPKGLNDQVKQALGITGGQALGAGLQGLAGILTARNAGSQGQQAKNQLQALATPYQAQGAQQVSAAQAGQLSTASQQAYQAAQARAAQAAASGGISGAGVVQVNAQLENLRQQLLQGDLNIGLQIQSIGDKIAQGAIQAGVQADQYVNSLTSNYASNVARIVSGQTQQTNTQPGATT